MHEFDILSTERHLSVLRLEETRISDCLQLAAKKMESLLKRLSLTDCTFKADELTHESGWVASPGQVFRVTGCFEVSSSRGGDEITPLAEILPSFALWKLNLLTNPDYKDSREYFKQLIKQGLSNKEAYKEVYKDYTDMDMFSWPEELPSIFEGKIITLPPLKEKSTFNPNEDLRLLVKQPVFIRHTRNCFGEIDIPYGGKIEKVLYDSNEANWINWDQPYAQIDLTSPAKCRIRLSRSNEFDKEPKLYIPKPKEQKLVLPYEL